MLSSSDSTTLTLWLNSQTSAHTRSCYRRDADRLLAHAGKPLNAIGLQGCCLPLALFGFFGAGDHDRNLCRSNCAGTPSAETLESRLLLT
jgi:hypothetical protein